MTTTQKTKSELYQDAERILDNFNFAEVQQHMQQVDWRWYSAGQTSVPSIEELRICARDLLNRLINSAEPIYRVGTGGFQAVQFPWGIELFFVIESSR